MHNLSLDNRLASSVGQRDFMTRSELAQDFKKDPGKYATLSNDLGRPLPLIFNQLSPQPEDGYPVGAMEDMLARNELRISSNPWEGTATLGDFINNGMATELLCWSQLRWDYDRCSGLNELYLKNLELDNPDIALGYAVATTETGLADDSPARRRRTYPLQERNRFAPPISLADLGASIETIPEDTFQIPTYDVDADDEKGIIVSELGSIPYTTLSVARQNGEMFMIAEGVATSRRFRNSPNTIRMGLLRMWIRRMGLRHQITIINMGLNTLIDAAKGTGGVTQALNARTALKLKDILDVNLFYTMQDGYSLQVMFALKSLSTLWIQANVRAGTADQVYYSLPPDGRFESAFPAVQIINNNVGPTRLGIVGTTTEADPEDGTKLLTTEMLSLDPRFALILFRQSTGFVVEEDYNPAEQLRRQFFSQVVGWMNQDVRAAVLFTSA